MVSKRFEISSPPYPPPPPKASFSSRHGVSTSINTNKFLWRGKMLSVIFFLPIFINEFWFAMRIISRAFLSRWQLIFLRRNWISKWKFKVKKKNKKKTVKIYDFRLQSLLTMRRRPTEVPEGSLQILFKGCRRWRRILDRWRFNKY